MEFFPPFLGSKLIIADGIPARDNIIIFVFSSSLATLRRKGEKISHQNKDGVDPNTFWFVYIGIHIPITRVKMNTSLHKAGLIRQIMCVWLK